MDLFEQHDKVNNEITLLKESNEDKGKTIADLKKKIDEVKKSSNWTP